MDNEKVIKELQKEIKPFRTVLLADPLYLKEINEAKDEKNVKNLKSLIADYPKIPFTNRFSGVRLRQTEAEHDMYGTQFSVTSYQMSFYTAKNDELGEHIIKTELSDCYIPDYIKEQKQLGCDTAEFVFQVDDKIQRISTLCDGIYGYCSRYKNNTAFVFHIFLDSDAVTWDELCQMAEYFFEEKKR